MLLFSSTRTPALLRTEILAFVLIPAINGGTLPDGGTTTDARCHLPMGMWSIGNGNRKERRLLAEPPSAMKFRTCDGFNARSLQTIRTSPESWIRSRRA